MTKDMQHSSDEIVDLGDARIETKGQHLGLVPDEQDTRISAGMTDE